MGTAMPTLKSIFFASPPPPAPAVDTGDLADLSDLELRARIDDIARERREVVAQHQARIAPVLEERVRLEQQIGAIDAKLAWEGIQRQDRERELDHHVQALQAELHARVRVADEAGAADDDVVDERAVDRLLNQMLSGTIERNSVIGGNLAMSEACEAYDRLEQALRRFARNAAQSLSASGRMPDLPDDLRGFSDQLRREICLKEGLPQGVAF